MICLNMQMEAPVVLSAADILRREAVYFWYYFSVQLEQIFWYWILGMVIGSFISVFIKDHIHNLFRSLGNRKLGAFGTVIASALGILSPLCMYGTIPIAASFSKSGMGDDWLASFMLTGPATKITNLGALKIVLGIKRFLLYLLFVMAFSFFTGLLVNIIV